jgi:4-hydroxy-2-oxoheptanedioate aldolase
LRTAQAYGEDHSAHTLAAALIEDAEAFDELDQIVATPSLDIFAIGPGDLAASMGLVGQAQHPEVAARVERAAAAVVAAGKVLLAATPTTALARSAASAGAKMVVTSVQGLLGTELKRFARELDDLRCVEDR